MATNTGSEEPPCPLTAPFKGCATQRGTPLVRGSEVKGGGERWSAAPPALWHAHWETFISAGDEPHRSTGFRDGHPRRSPFGCAVPDPPPGGRGQGWGGSPYTSRSPGAHVTEAWGPTHVHF